MTVGAAVEWSCPEPDQGVIDDDDDGASSRPRCPWSRLAQRIQIGAAADASGRPGSLGRPQTETGEWMDGWMDG